MGKLFLLMLFLLGGAKVFAVGETLAKPLHVVAGCDGVIRGRVDDENRYVTVWPDDVRDYGKAYDKLGEFIAQASVDGFLELPYVPDEPLTRKLIRRLAKFPLALQLFNLVSDEVVRANRDEDRERSSVIRGLALNFIIEMPENREMSLTDRSLSRFLIAVLRHPEIANDPQVVGAIREAFLAHLGNHEYTYGQIYGLISNSLRSTNPEIKSIWGRVKMKMVGDMEIAGGI